MRKKVTGILALLGILGAAAPASADYICNWALVPGSTPAGNSGYLQVTTYSGPTCTGSFTGLWYYCSSSATSLGCALPAMFTYSDTDLSALNATVTQAALWNLKVNPGTTNCVGGGSGCASIMTFHPYGY